MKSKKKNSNPIKDILKTVRKESREAEIKAHGKPIRQSKVAESKTAYKRNKRVNLDEME